MASPEARELPDKTTGATRVEDTSLRVDYWKALVQYAKDEKEEPAFGQFKTLQAMNITHLFNEIARIKADIEYNQTTSFEKMSLLRQTLHQYGEYNAAEYSP
jgi:hypothetical protein